MKYVTITADYEAARMLVRIAEEYFDTLSDLYGKRYTKRYLRDGPDSFHYYASFPAPEGIKSVLALRKAADKTHWHEKLKVMVYNHYEYAARLLPGYGNKGMVEIKYKTADDHITVIYFDRY